MTPGIDGGRTAAQESVPGVRLRVDPVACDGIGLCAHLAPDVVGLDRWGFPVVPTRELMPGEVRAAGRAVRGCPRRALWLESATDDRGATGGAPVRASTGERAR